jgi:hypothetical protein
MKIIEKNEWESDFWSGTGPRLACPVLGTGLRTTGEGVGWGGGALPVIVVVEQLRSGLAHDTNNSTLYCTVHM